MGRARPVVLAIAILSLFAASGGLEACGARTGLRVLGQACVPGESRSCIGRDGCLGSERCLQSAREWSECECAQDAGTPEFCFERTFRGQSKPVSLLFLVDRSGSMIAFWSEATAALAQFFSDPDSAGLNVALEFFPAEGDECDESAYLAPEVPFGLLETTNDTHQLRLLGALNASDPFGGTPTFPAYSGAISTARDRAQSAGGPQTVAVVMVTDGEPTGCGSQNSTGPIVDLAEKAVAGASPVRTFAIGLEGASRALVELVAQRGKGESYFISAGDVADDLTGTFEGIRSRLVCEFLVETDSELRPEDVTVTLATGGGAPKNLLHDPACTSGGWVMHDNPPSISLCPETCRIARNDDKAALSIAARCAKVNPGDGGGGSAGRDAGTRPVLALLGAACKNDADCGKQLICLTSDGGAIEEGSPPRGLCTKQCTQDSVCEALDADSSCEPLGELGSVHYCVERCKPGPRFLSYFDTEKCHGRPELACSALGKSSARSVCMPQCNDDTDCEAGFFCHPRDGLCRKTPAAGQPVGRPCGGPNGCRGHCITIGGSETCAEWCTDGAKNACGRAFSGVLDQLCILSFTTILSRGGPGVGDQGGCVELCDVDADCGNPSVTCVPFGFGQYEQQTGRKGMCGVGFDTSIDPPR